MIVESPPKSLTKTINWVSKAHDNQYRKGTNIPYISHVFGVVTLLMRNGISDDAIIKALLLHNTIEDTDITLKIIKEKFGETINSYVSLISKNK